MNPQHINHLCAAATYDMQALGCPFSIDKLLEYGNALETKDFTSVNQERHLRSRLDTVLALATKGNVHSIWSFDGAKSGRWTCREPSVQNMTKELIHCMEGVSITDAISIEPFVAAKLAGEKKILDVYAAAGDLYQSVADELSISRQEAKIFFMSTMFGATIEGTAERLGVKDYQAQIIQTRFEEKYESLFRLMDEVARRPVVKTALLGKTLIVDRRDPRYIWKMFAMLVQGTAADVMKCIVAELHTLRIPLHAIIHDSVVYPNSVDPQMVENVFANAVPGYKLRTATTAL